MNNEDEMAEGDECCVMCEIQAQIDDTTIDLKMKMTNFPKGSTRPASKDHEGFIRAMQDAVIEFLGSNIDRVDDHGMIKKDGDFTEQEISDFKAKMRAKDPSLN